MNNLGEPQLVQTIHQNIKNISENQLTQAQIIEAYKMNYLYLCYQMMSRQRQNQGFRPIRRQQFCDQDDDDVKQQEIQSYEQNNSDNQQNIICKKTRSNSSKKGSKIKKRKKQNDRNTQKNLLVHLKLWLQRFIDQKGRNQPMIRKQFELIFTNGVNKSSREVYMNLFLLQKVLQNQNLRPCLKQFFERRILRYLMSSNIQNKICIMKYIPILLKKYTQGKCQSLKS